MWEEPRAVVAWLPHLVVGEAEHSLTAEQKQGDLTLMELKHKLEEGMPLEKEALEAVRGK